MPRQTKDTKYEKNQEAIVNELWSILENKKEVYLCDMDSNEKLKEGVMRLREDITKYYSTKGMKQSFTSEAYDHDRDYLRLIKFVFKKHGYNVYSSRCMIPGEKRWTQKYTILKKETVKLL